MDIKQPYTLRDIAKYPMAVLCSFLIGLCIYLMANQGSDCSKCEEDKKQLNDKIWNLSMMVLEKNQVIGDQRKVIKRTDSLIREETEEPIKQILNQLNK
ncbi:MAG: hypothetical protein H7Y13_11825 [Sphingobacteriaceae bacterium]|nr:hypothetical protein [Sphingobacteriaceae bacterium]